MQKSKYDDPVFFAKYSQMNRSKPQFVLVWL